MISPCYPQSTARESDDGDQLQGSPFPQGHHSHGGAVVRGLSLELPACGRTHGGVRCPGRPRDYPALGGEIQSLIGGSVSSPEAVGLGQLAHIPPDLVVKSQAIDITEVILSFIRW